MPYTREKATSITMVTSTNRPYVKLVVTRARSSFDKVTASKISSLAMTTGSPIILQNMSEQVMLAREHTSENIVNHDIVAASSRDLDICFASALRSLLLVMLVLLLCSSCSWRCCYSARSSAHSEVAARYHMRQ